jgi:hypothetical protein
MCAHRPSRLLRLLLLATVVPAGAFIHRPAVSVRARRLKFVGDPSHPSAPPLSLYLYLSHMLSHSLLGFPQY